MRITTHSLVFRTVARQRQANTERLTLKQRRFLMVFTLLLFIVFSPSKALGQVTALLLIGALLAYVQVSLANHLIKLVALVVSLSGGIGFYALISADFSLLNYLLFCVTISSTFLLLWNFSSIISPHLLSAIVRRTGYVIVFESLYGVIQACVGAIRNGSFDVGNGDLVRGTINPSFQHIPSASNPIYAVLLSTLLFFIFGASRNRLNRSLVPVYLLGIVAWLLASVMHTIIFFMVAVALSLGLLLPVEQLLRPRSKRLRKARRWILVIGGVLLIAVLVILPRNVANIPTFFQETLDVGPNSHSEKARATYATFVQLPKTSPLQPVLGLGPGHYSSRASLIISGEYLDSSLSSIIPVYQTSATNRYIISLWRNFLKTRPNGGSTYFPFYSWLSLYGELGWGGVAAVVLLIVYYAVRLRAMASREFPRLHFALIVLMIYIALLGFQDNYWEITQAVCPSFLLFKLGYDYLRVEKTQRRKLLMSYPEGKFTQ